MLAAHQVPNEQVLAERTELSKAVKCITLSCSVSLSVLTG